MAKMDSGGYDSLIQLQAKLLGHLSIEGDNIIRISCCPVAVHHVSVEKKLLSLTFRFDSP